MSPNGSGLNETKVMNQPRSFTSNLYAVDGQRVLGVLPMLCLWTSGMHPDHCGGTTAVIAHGSVALLRGVAAGAARSTSLTGDDSTKAAMLLLFQTHQQNLPDLHDQRKGHHQVLQLQYQILDFVLLATTRPSCPSLTSSRRRRMAETLWWTALGRVWKKWIHTRR